MQHRFEDIAFNSIAKRKPNDDDMKSYIGLEHLDAGDLRIVRHGSKVPIKGEKLIMRKGDVLFGRRNTYLKRAAIAPHDGLFSAHGMVLRPKEEVVTQEFFPFFISSDYFFEAAIRISVGSISPTVNWGTLKELEFELPPLNVQRRISEILWAAIEARNAYKELLTSTEQLVKSQFVEMFGDVFTGCEKFPKQSISSVTETDILKVGRTYANTDIIKYIDISSIDNEQNEIVQYTDHILENAPSRAQQVVLSGDILISTVRPNLKNVAIIRDTFENLVASTGFCVLRPTGKTNSEYLFAIARTDGFAEYLSRRAKGANYPAVNSNDVKEFKIPLPPIDLQNQFADFVQQADKSKFELQQTLDELEATYKALLRENLG